MNGGNIAIKDDTAKDDGKVNANIIIAGKIYRMRVTVEDEGNIRKAEKLIKAELDKYRQFKSPGILEELSVALLNIAVRLVEAQTLSVNKPLRSEVENIDRELGVYLEKQCSLDDIE
ncbi:MAG: cell division protein ZapA [Prevotellaceae bacterium]|jgi:ABC-type uncharacterized transport system ATPase subunit|nr:cell division protein ZapA [Prevotellaceae bacterium]